jgi:hypothetical protein
MTTYTLQTDCTCESYDDNDKLVPSNDCFGCYDDSLELLKSEVIEPWLEANDLYEDTAVRIIGTAIGWRRLSGYKDTTPKELVEALSLNGDYTLKFDLTGTTLSVKRYSHDEPTGARFFIVGLTTCDNSECDGECNSNYCANLPD